MSVYGGKEMAAAFRTVRRNTIQVAEDIPEDKYNFVPAPGVKPVGKTLTHMAISPGLVFLSIRPECSTPHSLLVVMRTI